jgi:transcriptional regulator with XRE-family HTH domain
MFPDKRSQGHSCSTALLHSGAIFGRMGKSRRVYVTDQELSVNNRVVQIRKALEYSQSEFAKGLKLSRSFQGGIEANHRRVNDRLIHMICLTYGVSEAWLKTGAGEMFDAAKPDPRLERIIRNFNSLDPTLQDYVIKHLDWLAGQYKKPK